MAYIISQYNHNSNSSDDSSFIVPIKAGTVSRWQNPGDTGAVSSLLNPFSDECITELNLIPSEYYYFRCQIKRMLSPQVFSIKLINFNDATSGSVEQFIKQISVKGGDREEWVDIEFIFHPVVTFDTILFQLQRTIEDYRELSRYPKIDYQQLGIINNIITSKIGSGISLLKIGVQSHPGLMMCINGEEIRISRTGIFEIKNGVIPVNFFSVTNAAIEVNQDIEDETSVEGWKYKINQEVEDIENDTTLTPIEKEIRYSEINSACFFGSDKEYKIDAFTLDYMYKDN